MKYGYVCFRCGPFEAEIPQDTIQCRCGRTAKREISIAINRTSLKSEARWDPVTGSYVENHRDFEYKIRTAQERESNELGMEVKLEFADPRDSDALGSLHGWGKDAREQDREPTPLKRQPRDAPTGDELAASFDRQGLSRPKPVEKRAEI